MYYILDLTNAESDIHRDPHHRYPYAYYCAFADLLPLTVGLLHTHAQVVRGLHAIMAEA